MAALVPFPPDRAALLRASTKPEAFTAIDPDTVAAILAAEAASAEREALSDRIPEGTSVTRVDAGFADHVISRAARRLMGSRGYNKDAGADEEIMALAQRADVFIAACGPSAAGGAGKRITPTYELDGAGRVVDGISVTSHRNADWFARSCGDPLRRAAWRP